LGFCWIFSIEMGASWGYCKWWASDVTDLILITFDGQVSVPRRQLFS
jgi:hypothetical protein